MLSGLRKVLAARSCLIALILSTFLSVPGCSGLINPYVEFQETNKNASFYRKRPNSPANLPQALVYLDRTMEGYRKVLGNRAEFRNLLGLTLIPLAAAITGL